MAQHGPATVFPDTCFCCSLRSPMSRTVDKAYAARPGRGGKMAGAPPVQKPGLDGHWAFSTLPLCAWGWGGAAGGPEWHFHLGPLI